MSDLLAIARSGTRAARAALDVTAHNIANASSEGYVRRSVSLSEVASTSIVGSTAKVTVSGVQVGGIVRNADMFRQAEVRRTGADAARADAEVHGLENVEAAVEQGGLYDASVKFEGALQRLVSNPTDGSLRAAVVESARSLASAFNVTAGSLDGVGEGLRFEAQSGVDQVNLLAAELARVNTRLSRASDSASDQTTLLDQRDDLLQKISGQAGISTRFAANGTVEVRLGGVDGAPLVSGGAASTMAMTTAGNGTIRFTVDGGDFMPGSGALVGKSQALAQLADTRTRIDNVAASVIATVNTAQRQGADLTGAAGADLFTGTTASTIGLAFTDGDRLATAPAGAGPKSRDDSNLTALRTALSSANPSGGIDKVLFEVSNAVAGRDITRDALASIADSANNALLAQTGVDLDQEAVNLVRFQQAFQASGRVIQVANDLFDTLLGIR
jgi:flagellar hook-associated protein 1 FlgK